VNVYVQQASILASSSLEQAMKSAHFSTPGISMRKSRRGCNEVISEQTLEMKI